MPATLAICGKNFDPDAFSPDLTELAPDGATGPRSPQQALAGSDGSWKRQAGLEWKWSAISNLTCTRWTIGDE
jgi:hypothetical protein